MPHAPVAKKVLAAAMILRNVPMVEFMYLVVTCMPGESYCRRLRSLLRLISIEC